MFIVVKSCFLGSYLYYFPFVGCLHVSLDMASHVVDFLLCLDPQGSLTQFLGYVWICEFDSNTISMVISGTQIGGTSPIYKAYFLGDIPPEYGPKYGTVPPF
jgi:hypothetical protein